MVLPLDVIIVGAGTAGLAALREVRKRTERFVIINDGPYGTTCARVGCMPSKVLLEAAHTYHRRHDLDAFGVRGAEGLRVDLPAVLRRVRALRDDFVAGALRATEGLGERSIAGRARLVAPDRVEVGGRELAARRIILAPGSRPFVPPAWRALGARVLTSDTIFEQEALPPRLAVVGLGAVGVELAQALARLGLEVTAFDRGRGLGGLTDPRVDGVFLDLLRREMPVHVDAQVEVTEGQGGLEVRAGAARAVVDGLVAAVGRRPNLDGLGLEALGVPLDARGLPPVDQGSLQVADLPLFLAGDANGRAPLLHEAADDGHIAGLNALADAPRCHRRRTPLALVFSDPNLAMVGRRRAQLDPEDTLTGEVSFERHGRARAALRARGLLRVYARRRDGRLLGAEMCAPAGEHLAHLLALAIERDLTVHDLLGAPFYHPVLEEALRAALRQIARELPRGNASDLAACEPIGCEALD